MQIDTTYTVTRIDSEGNDWIMGSCKTQEELQRIINLAKTSKPLQDVTIEITKTTVITDNFIVKAVAPTVDSVIAETIGQSDGQREFYYSEGFEYLSSIEKAIVEKAVEQTLDYCDHCGHLVDVGELSEDDFGSRLCEMCYSQQEEEDD